MDHKQSTYTVPHFQEDKGFTSGIFSSRELVMPEHLKNLESPNRRKREAGDKFRAAAYPGAGTKKERRKQSKSSADKPENQCWVWTSCSPRRVLRRSLSTSQLASISSPTR